MAGGHHGAVQPPKLVASDVDGTLLGVGDRPSNRTRAVLARMTAAGVPLVLATGRPPRWVPVVSEAVGGGALVVAANGAVLYDASADRVLAAETIDPPHLDEVVAGLREAIPGCGIAVERAAVGVGASGEQFLAESAFEHAWPDADHTEVAPGELTPEPAVKVLARHRTLTSDVMADAARRAVGHLVDVTFSSSGGLVECSRRGVTKATGLARAAAELRVAREDVVAFGDMPNDLAMLRWAGHGVGMANAHPDVLADVDEVTASNLSDGVASVLERWF